MQAKARNWLHPGNGSNMLFGGKIGELDGKIKSLPWPCLLEVLVRCPRGKMDWAEFRGGMKLRFLWEASYIIKG